MKVLTTLFVSLCLFTNLFGQQINFTSTCETVSFCMDESDCGPTLATLTATATTTCTTGNLMMNFTIDLNDDGTIETSGTGDVYSDNYPAGSHRITFTASDDCTNEAICDFLFLIEDCTPPIATILDGVSTETAEDCIATLYATEIDNGSSDNCEINTMLIVSPSQGPDQTMPPAEASELIEFSLCELGTQTLDFWISDEAGNWSYVSTYIFVQDNVAPWCNNFPCNDVCFYSETECGQAIENVTYYATWAGIPPLTAGDNDCIDIVPIGSSFTLSAGKDINPLNGVSTFDMILMSRHILGIESLDSPYKMIAADANRSGTITTIDLIEIRRLILGIDATFQNNTSWRFIDAVYVFPDPQNPFQTPVPDLCTINNLSEDIEKNFIGVKIGDVNKSSDPFQFVDNHVDNYVNSRSNTTFTFDLMNQSFEAGETITIDFRTTDIDQYSGFQFELAFDKDFLVFEDIKQSHLKYLTPANFGTATVDQGKISASWINNDFDQIIKTDDPLFTLQFTALKSGSLKELIQLSSSRLISEAYTNELNISAIEIHFSEVVSKTEFNLQNIPNPFHEETLVQFDLPETDQVTLKVVDVKGKVIYTTRQNLAKGFNTIKLAATLFPSDGMYFYHLETSTGSRTKKFLKM